MPRTRAILLTHARPPSRELFFAPLYIALNPTELEMVQFAYQCSKYGHAKQLRDDGTRYFDHPKSAAWIYIHELGGRDPRVIILLLLHDMQEDQFLLSPYRFCINFGQDIAHDAVAVTKLPKGKETTAQYLARVIAQGPRAILAKICDRLHNLRDCVSKEKFRKQVLETRKYHLPLLIPALRGFGNEWATYADTLEGKLREAMKSHR